MSDKPTQGSDQVSQATTIQHLIDAVRSPVLQVLAAPRGLDLRVRCTVLHDPVDQLELEPDAVLLMVGLRADSAAAIDIVRKAAECG